MKLNRKFEVTPKLPDTKWLKKTQFNTFKRAFNVNFTLDIN
jgi:hypothetical protein